MWARNRRERKRWVNKKLPYLTEPFQQAYYCCIITVLLLNYYCDGKLDGCHHVSQLVNINAIIRHLVAIQSTNHAAGWRIRDWYVPTSRHTAPSFHRSRRYGIVSNVLCSPVIHPLKKVLRTSHGHRPKFRNLLHVIAQWRDLKIHSVANVVVTPSVCWFSLFFASNKLKEAWSQHVLGT